MPSYAVVSQTRRTTGAAERSFLPVPSARGRMLLTGTRQIFGNLRPIRNLPRENLHAAGNAYNPTAGRPNEARMRWNGSRSRIFIERLFAHQVWRLKARCLRKPLLRH